MEEQEQQQPQNEVQEEQNVQMEPTSPTPPSPPPSHKKLIIGIAAVFVLIVAGAYFVFKPQASVDTFKFLEQKTETDYIISSSLSVFGSWSETTLYKNGTFLFKEDFSSGPSGNEPVCVEGVIENEKLNSFIQSLQIKGLLNSKIKQRDERGLICESSVSLSVSLNGEINSLRLPCVSKNTEETNQIKQKMDGITDELRNLIKETEQKDCNPKESVETGEKIFEEDQVMNDAIEEVNVDFPAAIVEFKTLDYVSPNDVPPHILNGDEFYATYHHRLPVINVHELLFGWCGDEKCSSTSIILEESSQIADGTIVKAKGSIEDYRFIAKELVATKLKIPTACTSMINKYASYFSKQDIVPKYIFPMDELLSYAKNEVSPIIYYGINGKNIFYQYESYREIISHTVIASKIICIYDVPSDSIERFYISANKYNTGDFQ